MTVASPGRADLVPVTTREALDEVLSGLRGRGHSLALVPTMGYLHEGHLRLVDEARREADAVAMTIFVNPLQFDPGEDLERYPRDLDHDVERAAERGVDLLFAPSLDEMYPHGPPTVWVDPGPMGKRLCGAYRPNHFGGVLTVVARLFGLFRPDAAIFGRKDYQQAVLVRRMVRDLGYPVRIAVGPLVRESDGLALSSRNAYLSTEERDQATGLFRALSAADAAFREGVRTAELLLDAARAVLAETPLLRLQYLELVDPDTLDPLDEARSGSVLAVAAHCGPSRLIDNVILGSDDEDPRVPPDPGGVTSSDRAPRTPSRSRP